MCLFYNHSYPPRYIHSRFNNFFSSYLLTLFVLPIINRENDFSMMRRMLLTKPNIPEYQIVLRIAKTIDVNSKEEVDNPLVKAQLDEQIKSDSNFIIHCTHEK